VQKEEGDGAAEQGLPAEQQPETAVYLQPDEALQVSVVHILLSLQVIGV
jgi:hypothetical protein